MRRLLYLTWLLAASAALAQSPPPPPPQGAPHPAGGPHSCMPYYPPEEAKAHIEGRVLVSFTIKTDGTVSDVAVARSSGNADLDAAAVTCVRTWAYQPVMRDGVAVELPWRAFVDWHVAPGAAN